MYWQGLRVRLVKFLYATLAPRYYHRPRSGNNEVRMTFTKFVIPNEKTFHTERNSAGGFSGIFFIKKVERNLMQYIIFCIQKGDDAAVTFSF